MKKFLLLLASLLFIITVNAQTNTKDTLLKRRVDVKDAHDQYANKDSAAYLQVKPPYKPSPKAVKKILPKRVGSR